MTFTLSVEPIPSSELPSSDSLSSSTLLPDLVEQALDVLKKSESWALAKTVSTKEGKVKCRSGKSGMQGRLGKCGWHLRESTHPVDAPAGLSYDDFRNGLLLDHPRQESQYMEGMTGVKEIQLLKPGVAEIWLNSYKMPIVTADRDFLELIITIDLPNSKEPFSDSHVAEILSGLKQNPAPELNPQSSSEQDFRSFLVVSVPVKHEQAPDQKNYVRASYASVEAIYETESEGKKAVEWKMFVQSDSAGSIPLFLQEMSVPGKIVHDVPLFMGWARQQKIKKGEDPPHSSQNQTPIPIPTANSTALPVEPTDADTKVPAETEARKEVEPESKAEADALAQPGAAREAEN